MRKHEKTPGYSTPKQAIVRSSSNHSLSNHHDRYMHSRKLDCVPGFDLGTPSYLEPTEACPLYQAIKNPQPAFAASDYSLFPFHPFSQPSLFRELPTQPDRILDAPDIVDDFYLNLVSWSDTNVLAVSLRNKLYLWNGNNGTVSELLDYSSGHITSVSWMRGGKCIAVGDSNHCLKLFDTEKLSEIRNILVHNDRVSSLAWNGYVLSSGSRDSYILNHDLRIQNYFIKYSSHSQEVCGLQWSPDFSSLASGGNDNKLCIWELSNPNPVHQLNEHKAAVKALAWCPWKNNLLASGGGSSDRQIKIWDSIGGNCLNSVDSGSQVCALEWNKNDKELLSAHGYSQNQLILWRYADMSKMSEFYGHTGRVLGMCQSPDGANVVTAGADETLRFWSIFKSSVTKTGKKNPPSPGLGCR
jgi:cell division cycle protein 20 (cofactor of APC complex)